MSISFEEWRKHKLEQAEKISDLAWYATASDDELRQVYDKLASREYRKPA